MATYKTLNINKVIADTEDKLLAVIKNSIQDLIEEVSKPQKAGGKMHVDTGFLRSSGTAALNELPVGPTEGEKRQTGQKGVLYTYNPSGAIHDALIKMTINDMFVFGWTARYAEIREIYDGFLVSGCDKWQEIVNNNARKLRK